MILQSKKVPYFFIPGMEPTSLRFRRTISFWKNIQWHIPSSSGNQTTTSAFLSDEVQVSNLFLPGNVPAFELEVRVFRYPDGAILWIGSDGTSQASLSTRSGNNYCCLNGFAGHFNSFLSRHFRGSRHINQSVLRDFMH
uniref:Uncharacterized protein n=2 Tax=Oryza TaxID=4527 RepID=D4QDA7_ORYSI|nr:hypothetical protein [Oryza rufipogon]BAI94523.1 hypothetical protein [Oryza sativa Indica Group]BCM88165.1 hypothetical protein [Oryza sativa Indica Group]